VVGPFLMERGAPKLFVELQPLRTSFEGHPWDWGAWQPEVEGRTQLATIRTPHHRQPLVSARSCACPATTASPPRRLSEGVTLCPSEVVG
jgi:hypothetical protein